MKLSLLALLGVSLALGACSGTAAEEDGDEGFALDAAATGGRAYRPDLADVDGWKWHTRSGACAPSPQARTILDAALGARHSNDIVPRELVLTSRNAAGPALLDSSEMFPALGGLIAKAEHEVDIQWHVIDSDSDGFHDVIGGIAKLHERLVAERGAGKSRTSPVVVRVLSPDWVLRPGNSVQKFASAIRRHAGALDPSLLRLEVAAHKYVSLAVMHVKMAIVDGVYVHVGGGNLSNHQNYHDGAAHERDSAYVVKGEIGKASLAQFDDVWMHRMTTAYACNAERCRKMDDRGKRSGHATDVANPDLAKAGVPADACLPMVFLAKRASEFVPSWDIDHPIGKGFRAAFGSATRVLKISTPNVNDRFVGPIIDAAKANDVEVRVLVPMTFNEIVEAVPYLGGGTNRMTAWWLAFRIGKENVGPGKDLDLRWFSIDGRTIQRGGWATGGRHIKYYSVDEQLAIVGSTNLDKQSMSRSREVGIVVDDPTVTREWDAKIFDADFSKAIPMLRENDPPAPPAQLPEENLDTAPEDVQDEYNYNL